MENQRMAIAERIKGLRDASDFTVESIARDTGIPVETYRQYEEGIADVPMSTISILANLYKVDPTTILTGGDPHATVFRVTRKGAGAIVERRNVYHYEALSVLFAGKRMEPFIVTVDPSVKELHTNVHPGQEFNYILSGSIRLTVDGQSVVLNEGDSIYFDSTKPHGMQNEGNVPAKFLAIITDK
ncbi:MAG: helix-turn-helix transcriptional regulator [Kiritimatiellae bacterium]|nr:helix-turn-helix transcriptional regulator [Kiritimatiellia bacterium]